MSSELAATTLPPFTEDLGWLAAAQYRLADQLCGSCRNFHSLWPYRRIARLCGAAEAGGSDVETTLAELFRGGRRRVLIAGAADTGLLALTARAGGGNVEIVVIDRCRTPLELCRLFAQRWWLTMQALHQDLTTLEMVAGFDVVFANSVLQFIAPERRVDFLSRLRRALRPNGRLVNVFNVSERIAGQVLTEYRADYSGWVLAELDRRGIALPEPREPFARRLDEYAREFETREGTFNALDDFLALHERAGFQIVSSVETGMGLAAPWRELVAKLAKRRYILLAEPMGSGRGP